MKAPRSCPSWSQRWPQTLRKDVRGDDLLYDTVANNESIKRGAMEPRGEVSVR